MLVLDLRAGEISDIDEKDLMMMAPELYIPVEEIPVDGPKYRYSYVNPDDDADIVVWEFGKEIFETVEPFESQQVRYLKEQGFGGDLTMAPSNRCIQLSADQIRENMDDES